MNAYRALDRGVQPELELSWLYAIANHVIGNRRRSASRRRRVETPSDLHVVAEVVGDEPPQTEELVHIGAALSSLSERQRRAVLLREWQGFSYAEIARELDVSLGSVEQLLFRARASLARTLSGAKARGIQLGTLIFRLREIGLGSAGAKIAAAVTTGAVALGPTLPALVSSPSPHPVAAAVVREPTIPHVPVRFEPARAAVISSKRATPPSPAPAQVVLPVAADVGAAEVEAPVSLVPDTRVDTPTASAPAVDAPAATSDSELKGLSAGPSVEEPEAPTSDAGEIQPDDGTAASRGLEVAAQAQANAAAAKAERAADPPGNSAHTETDNAHGSAEETQGNSAAAHANAGPSESGTANDLPQTGGALPDVHGNADAAHANAGPQTDSAPSVASPESDPPADTHGNSAAAHANADPTPAAPTDPPATVVDAPAEAAHGNPHTAATTETTTPPPADPPALPVAPPSPPAKPSPPGGKSKK